MGLGIRACIAVAAVSVLLAVPASAATDLRSVLAEPPPSSDWVEMSPSEDTRTGPFSAHRYDGWVNDKGDSERTLNSYGFVAGYDRAWQQSGTDVYLVERVFEFTGVDGAQNWLEDLRHANQESTDYVGDISTLAEGTSFAVELKDADGTRAFRVYFAKGNLMFEVRVSEATTDLSGFTLQQAQKQYDQAPDEILVVQGSSRPAFLSRAPTVAILGGWFVLVVIAVGAGLLTLVISSSRPAGTPAGAPISPEGYYWWDGQAWRPRNG